MVTHYINVHSVAVGKPTVSMDAILVQETPRPPSPPAPPPSLGRILRRLVNDAITADRIAQAAEHWWPTVKELGKELLDKLFRRPATIR